MRRCLVLLAVLACCCTISAAQNGSSLLGLWREPGGSVIRVFPCGSAVCVRLLSLPPNAPERTDVHNPDTKLRTRPLCALEIGYSFHPLDPGHAEDGSLYDPRSGNTYHGSMKVEGDQLKLRGWVGIKLFGRTETWTRVQQAPPSCAT